MLTTAALFTTQSHAAARRESTEGFARRAAHFLQEHLGPGIAGVDTAGLAELVARLSQDAQAAGAEGAARQLQYMVAAVIWGHRFVEDPQYEAALTHANWPKVLPARAQRLDAAFKALGNEIDAFEAAVAADRQDLARILAALERVARYDWRYDDAGLLPRAVAHVWPARAACLGEVALARIAQAHLAALTPLALERAEAALLTCLAFAFGHGLYSDPAHPWIARALTAAPGQRNAALLSGLSTYYDNAIISYHQYLERVSR